MQFLFRPKEGTLTTEACWTLIFSDNALPGDFVEKALSSVTGLLEGKSVGLSYSQFGKVICRNRARTSHFSIGPTIWPIGTEFSNRDWTNQKPALHQCQDTFVDQFDYSPI